MAPGLLCYCGKQFSQQSALSNHTRTCQISKKQVSDAISLARDAWESRKKQRRDAGSLNAPAANPQVDDTQVLSSVSHCHYPRLD
jgi:hypothetical protein